MAMTELIRMSDGAEVAVDVLSGGDRTILFLAGMGHTGWNLEYLASHFAGDFRCVLVTRRGIGASSKDNIDYSLPRAISDLVDICAALDVTRAIWVGHSFGCIEIEQLSHTRPDLIGGAVLLDGAYDYTSDDALIERFDPSGPPAPTDADLASSDALAAYLVRNFGTRQPPRDIEACHTWSAEGSCTGRNEHHEAAPTMLSAPPPPDYSALARMPVLGVFAQPASWLEDMPGVAGLDDKLQRKYADFFEAMTANREAQILRFADALPDAMIGRPPHSGHHLHLSHEWLVVHWMRQWLRESSAFAAQPWKPD